MPKIEHASYPHHAGDLYDCEPCELIMLRKALGERTREGSAIIRSLWRMSADDPWGDGMMFAFGTGHVLHAAQQDGVTGAEFHWLFESNEYQPSQYVRESWDALLPTVDNDGGEWPDSEIADHVDQHKLSLADVAYWFRVACRYTDWLRSQHPEVMY